MWMRTHTESQAACFDPYVWWVGTNCDQVFQALLPQPFPDICLHSVFFLSPFYCLEQVPLMWKQVSILLTKCCPRVLLTHSSLILKPFLCECNMLVTHEYTVPLISRIESLHAIQKSVISRRIRCFTHFHELMLIYIKLVSRNKIQVITTLVKYRNDCESRKIFVSLHL